VVKHRDQIDSKLLIYKDIIDSVWLIIRINFTVY